MLGKHIHLPTHTSYSHQVPYTTEINFTDGTTVTFHKRERPHLVWAAGKEGVTPTHLVTGVVQPGSNEHGYSGLSYTLIQPLHQRS